MNEFGFFLFRAFGFAILVYGLGCVGFLLGNRIYRSRLPLRLYAYLAEDIPPGRKALRFLRHTAYLAVFALSIYALSKYF